ncbi:MAG: hypothetical protein WCA49_11985 [Candidatus Sulfotelmatobacter sp.]
MEIAKLILEYIRAMIWPTTVLALSFFFRGEIRKVFARLRKAVLPGGVSIDLQEEVREVKQLSERVESAPLPADRKKSPGIPQTEANARLIQLGLRPSPSGLDLSYYREISERDPILALAGLRIELETWFRNVAQWSKVDMRPFDSMNRILARLRDANAVTPDQVTLARRVLSFCNQAIHGGDVTKEQAIDIIGAASVLARDYLAWLSWGFDDNWKPSQT